MTQEAAADAENHDAPADMDLPGIAIGAHDRGVIRTAFSLLDHIGALEPVRLHDLAQAAGIPRPTVHRLLQQLMAVGAVGRRGKRYCLGASLLGLGSRVTPERRLRVAARRPMAELAAATGAAVNLTATIDGHLVYLDTIEARAPLAFVAEPGAAVPAGTAEARAHVTFGRSAPIVDAGGVLPNLSCVAAPVELGSGQFAAISVLVAASRPQVEVLTLTRMAAMRISGLLQTQTVEPTLARNPVPAQPSPLIQRPA
jgi:DNA-binding IclR family transcriptional regulator